MATFSGKGSGTTGASSYTLKLDVWENSVDKVNNKSNVGWALKLDSGAYSFADWGIPAYVNVDGEVYNASPKLSIGTNSEITIASGSKDIYHNSDGSKTISCYGKINNTGAYYLPGVAECSGTLTLTKIPRYATSNQSLNNKTVNSIKMNWSSDSTIDYIWYSKDNGSNWIAVGSVNASSGSYTISGLNPNTSYNIKTRVRRKDSQLTTDSSTLAVTTYDYAKINSAPNITIGNSAKVSYSNPSGATIAISIYKTDGSTEIAGYRACSSSSYTFNFTSAEINKMYNTIPNATSIVLRYYLRTTVNGVNYYSSVDRTFSININNNKPTFNDFNYEDTDAAIIALTGNNQRLVNKLSNIKVVIPTSKKAVAKNGATISRYRIAFLNYKMELSYSNSDVGVEIGRFDTTKSNPQIMVTAIDSRGLETSVVKEPIWVNYRFVDITVSALREKGIGTKVFFNLSGTYWDGNFGAIQNAITATFSYRKKGDSTWSDAIDISSKISQEKGKYTTITTNKDNILPTTNNGNIPIAFEFGKEYEIMFNVEDKTSRTLSYIYLLSSGVMATSKRKNADGTYSVGINKLADEGFAFDVLGNSKLNGHDMDNFFIRNDGVRIANSQIFSNIFSYESTSDKYGICFVTIGKVKPILSTKFVIKGCLQNNGCDTEFEVSFFATSSTIANAKCKIENMEWLKDIYVCNSDDGLMLGFVHSYSSSDGSYDTWKNCALFIESIYTSFASIDLEQIKSENWQVLFQNDFYITTKNVKCTLQDNAIVISKDLTLSSANTWYDTGIAYTNLSAGTYIMQLYINAGSTTSQYQEYLSGVLAWFDRVTNSTNADEIPLSKSGHARNNHNIKLRVQRVGGSNTGAKLQISDTIAWSGSATCVFRFKKII